jgi:hypothetical protein
MAEVKGKLISCDRCGATAFVRCIGEGERDGGFTRWNKFEDEPDGWDWHHGVGKLCPRCNQEYLQMIASFKIKGGAKNDT